MNRERARSGLGWGAWLVWVVVFAIPAGAADASPRRFRAITDPHTGQQWLLLRNEENPAGPGQLVRASGRAAHQDARLPALPIHPGDKIVVEAHSAAMDAYFEATALQPAAAGSPLSVRLKIGGRVVKAVALGPGRAEVQP
jgi:hypothetical protein